MSLCRNKRWVIWKFLLWRKLIFYNFSWLWKECYLEQRLLRLLRGWTKGYRTSCTVEDHRYMLIGNRYLYDKRSFIVTNTRFPHITISGIDKFDIIFVHEGRCRNKTWKYPQIMNLYGIGTIRRTNWRFHLSINEDRVLRNVYLLYLMLANFRHIYFSYIFQAVNSKH